MDIKDIQEKKRETEKEIRQLLQLFHDTTRACPRDISFTFTEVYDTNGSLCELTFVDVAMTVVI